ncbi:MAG TPA: hypothetical protein VME68_14780 [Acidobacteriaceae bacterium]|nr:hypothetical protein [Acidobacteriaceae bacterium]
MEDAEGQSGTFVTVRRYRDLSEAIVAKSLLESAGIAAWIRDENIARMEWQYSNLLGGVRLQVESGDQAAAEEVLGQPIPETVAFDSQKNFEQPKCPACGSIDITYEGASRGAALVSVTMLSLPLPHGGTSWRCNACAARWHDSADDAPEEAAVLPAPRDGKAKGESSVLEQFGYGLLPIVLALALLDAGLRVRAMFWPDLVLSALVLWFGRRWMAGTLLTRSAGISLGIVMVLLPVLLSDSAITGVGPIAALAGCLSIPVMLWDLFIRQPYKGRFSRARAERRGTPQ